MYRYKAARGPENAHKQKNRSEASYPVLKQFTLHPGDDPHT